MEFRELKFPCSSVDMNDVRLWDTKYMKKSWLVAVLQTFRFSLGTHIGSLSGVRGASDIHRDVS